MGIKEELIFVLRAKMEEFVTGIVEGHYFASPKIRKMFNFDFSGHSTWSNLKYYLNKAYIMGSYKVELLKPLLYGVTAMSDDCERLARFLINLYYTKYKIIHICNVCHNFYVKTVKATPDFYSDVRRVEVSDWIEKIKNG